MTKYGLSVKILILILAGLICISMIPCASAESDSVMEVYFLDVGEGDASVIICDGDAMMIDGGSAEYSDYIYSFLKNKGISRLDYIIATHPDADHVGGLSGALNYADSGCVLCTVKNHDTVQFSSFLKYLSKQNNRIIVPEAGDTFSLGTASVTILGPTRGIQCSDNTSISLKICFGDKSFLFMGDNEAEDEDALVKSKKELSADVLKVGHHGSSSSSSLEFIKRVNPEYSVISVGKDNIYGHPADDVIKRLNDVKTEIYRTDLNGEIHCVCDGKRIKFTCEKNDQIDTNSSMKTETVSKSVPEGSEKTVTASTDYIVNTNTGKFHYPYCGSVSKMKESNKMYYSGSRDELVSRGYSPCGKCHP